MKRKVMKYENDVISLMFMASRGDALFTFDSQGLSVNVNGYETHVFAEDLQAFALYISENCQETDEDHEEDEA
jgi:hypothetical protein